MVATTRTHFETALADVAKERANELTEVAS
jgi:hypothetical protein